MPAEVRPGNTEHGHVTGGGPDDPVGLGVVTGEQFAGFQGGGPAVLHHRDPATVMQGQVHQLLVAGGNGAAVPGHRCGVDLYPGHGHRPDVHVVDHGMKRRRTGIRYPQGSEQGRGRRLERLGSIQARTLVIRHAGLPRSPSASPLYCCLVHKLVHELGGQ